ncbi:MAG: hypothetical protein QME96_18175, partial [Myxococcota bacterium]|nr:hypothetical protein [Myxococcota bacterium]
MRPWAAVLVFAASGCGDDDSTADAGQEFIDDGGADGEADGEEAPDGEAVEGDAVEEATEDGAAGCEQRFWIWDLSVMPPRDAQICASRRGEGANAHVWVQDEEWGVTVVPEDVAEILHRWDVATPAESVAPDQGIFAILTGIFGDPPDVFDGDPKIHIFLYGMGAYGASEFDGYFRSTDQTGDRTSNRREMIHINTRTRRHVAEAYMIGVMAHEFHHLLQWGLDAGEETWLSESFAELAMLLTGYFTDLPAAYAWVRRPSAPLIVFDAFAPVDYGAAFLFGAYLRDRLSTDGVADLVADRRRGAASVHAAVQLVDPGALFVEFLADFAAAVLLDDETIGDGRYGFLDLDLPAAGATSVAFPAAARTIVVPAGGIVLAR